MKREAKRNMTDRSNSDSNIEKEWDEWWGLFGPNPVGEIVIEEFPSEDEATSNAPTPLPVCVTNAMEENSKAVDRSRYRQGAEQTTLGDRIEPQISPPLVLRRPPNRVTTLAPDVADPSVAYNRLPPVNTMITGETLSIRGFSEQSNAAQDNKTFAFLQSPLAEKLDPKVDRSTKLIDQWGNTPALILHGHFPKKFKIEIESAMVVRYGDEDYHSPWRFDENKSPKEFADKLRRPVAVQECGNDLYRIELKHWCIRKRPIYESRGSENTYELVKYPSGETCLIASKKGCTNFACQYLDRTKLAIRLFQDYSSDPLTISGTGTRGDVLYSNELHKAPKKCQDCQLGVEAISPSGNIILFDGTDRYLMEFLVKIPDKFFNRNQCERQFLKASLMNCGHLSTLYKIVTQNGSENEIFHPVAGKSFRLQFTVVKYSANELTQSADFTEALDQLKREYEHSRRGLLAVDAPVFTDPNAIVKVFGLDTFSVQLALAYGAENCDSSTIKTYDDIKPWTSSKFYEQIYTDDDVPLPISLEQGASSVMHEERITGQKRCNEECCSSTELPVTKTKRTTDGNE